MNINQYRKLSMKLASKGWDLRAKENGSFAAGRLISINGVKVIGNWRIIVYWNGTCYDGLYFTSFRQVQRWADHGFKDEFLPKIPLENGTFKIQKKVA